MARPKREPGVPEARERILEAFWELLEDNERDKITVSMVCEKAGCYRGTFYYHFDSMDGLVEKAIKDVLFGASGVQRVLTLLIMGETLPEKGVDDATSRSAWRLALIASHGELEMVESVIKKDVENAWRMMLCDEGEDLAPDSKTIIQAMTSLGISVFVEANSRRDVLDVDAHGLIFGSAVPAFVVDAAKCTLSWVCEVEGLSEDEARDRLAGYLHGMEKPAGDPSAGMV